MAQFGGDDHTIVPVSGKSLADAWKDLKRAAPAAEVTELLPQFRGTRCLSRYPLQECPFPGQCPPAIPGSYATKQKDNHLPCAQWATGEPAALRRYLSQDDRTRDSRSFRDNLLDWDVDGRWIDDMWHPYDPLLREPDAFHFFTPEEVHRCFRGKRIVFQGDSLVRQLFYRVVNYLRQLPTSVEHVFDWGTSSYQSFANGTDKWYPNCPDRQCTFPDDALYTVMFDWHNPWDPAGELNRLRNYKADVVVQGWNYWLAGDFDFGPLQRELAKFFDEGPWKVKFTWYTTPLRGPTETDYREFRWRNRRMRQFVHSRRKQGQLNINVLPNDYLTTNGKGREIVRDRRPIDSMFNDVHFMADFLKSNFPEPLQPGLQHIKAPMDWDTRDVTSEEQEVVLQIRRNNGVAADLVEELARGNSSVQNTVNELKDNLAKSLQILSDELYSKPAHFVLETIQNADDNTYANGAAPELRVVLRESYMTIQCNEVGFSSANVKAFCGIGKSTKKNKAGYIGEKGIGAKAMFKVANKVHVHSLGYHFVLDREAELGMISPQWSSEVLNEPGWTLMRLDFCDGSQFSVVQAQLQHVRDTVLLFMRRLSRFKIDDGEQFSVSRSTDGNICTIRTKIGDSVSRKPYLRVSRRVAAFPQEPKRENVDTTEIVLAFPLDEDLRPVIAKQMVHAFLPMRSVGFKFIIQADFLTAANREDVLSNLQWNKKLRSGIAATFCSAVTDFMAMPSLELNWLLFLPDARDVADPFFSELGNTILNSLRTMEIVLCADGHYRAPASVRFPSAFAVDDEGIIPEKHLPFHYISPEYPINTHSKLRALGVESMSFNDFLSGLCRMGSTITLRGNDWLEDVCRLIIAQGFTWKQRIGSQPRDHRVRTLPLAQLTDGSWTTCELSDSLFFSGDSSRFPSGLGIDVLHMDGTSPQRRDVLARLGITTIDVNVVAKKIFDLHRGNMGLTVARTLEHDLYMFKWRLHLSQPITPNSLWLPDAGGQLVRGNQLYMDDAGSLPALSGLLEPPARFLHPDFVSPASFRSDEERLNAWRRWLHSHLGVSTVPRVISGMPAAEFIELIGRLQAAKRTSRLLTLLRQFWPGISSQLRDARDATRFNEFFGTIQVRCTNGKSFPLHSTFVPNERIAPFATADMPQLVLSDAQKDWSFLSKFGVSVDVNAAFFLKRLLALSQTKGVRKETVDPIYKQLEARFHEIPAEIRNTFWSEKVFLANKKWLSHRRVVWDGPSILTLKTSLKSKYPGLETLFREHLSIPDADPGIIADELKAFAEAHEAHVLTPDDRDRLSALLSYGAQTIASVKKGTCSDWTSSLRKIAYFPVARTETGKVRLRAQTSKFYLPDPSGRLKQLFSGKVWFLAFSPERLVDLRPLIDHVNLQSKRIDKRVRTTVSIDGEPVDDDADFGEIDPRETKAYQKRVCYFRRLQYYKGKRKDLVLLQSISVFKVETIDISYELDNGDVPAISKKRACWSRGSVDGHMDMFFASSCSLKERRADCEQEISRALGLSEDGGLAVSAIIRTDDDEELENTLRNAGIHELADEPSPSSDESEPEHEGDEDVEMEEASGDAAVQALPHSPRAEDAAEEIFEDLDNKPRRQSRSDIPAAIEDPARLTQQYEVHDSNPDVDLPVDVEVPRPAAQARRKSRRETILQGAPPSPTPPPARGRAQAAERIATPPAPAQAGVEEAVEIYAETEQGREEIEQVTKAAVHAWLPQVTPVRDPSFAEPTIDEEDELDPELPDEHDAHDRAQPRRHTRGGASLSGIALGRRAGQRSQPAASASGIGPGAHPSEDARTKQIGFLGERYVFELLKHHLKDCSPAFTYENWTSPFRSLAGHPAFDQQELSDFVYHDKSGTLTKHLFSRGSEYYKAAPEYFIEVKTTSGDQSETFHMKRCQFLQAMQMSRAARKPDDTLRLYVLLRVSGVAGDEAPVVKAYIDPHDMLSRGMLRLESDCVEMRIMEAE
ncbi:hypothetical protein AURDEDRAFT_186149 [Auricularia subglabra TFB-10046 SS5]|nr:hypothetical protein AURDEDRAFT_186149 [Auricularia subglabra TFB-10046 SS5]